MATWNCSQPEKNLNQILRLRWKLIVIYLGVNWPRFTDSKEKLHWLKYNTDAIRGDDTDDLSDRTPEEIKRSKYYIL